jgi:hypothetical protein
MADDEIRKLQAERVAFGKHESAGFDFEGEAAIQYNTFVEDDDDEDGAAAQSARSGGGESTDSRIRMAKELAGHDDGDNESRFSDRFGSGMVNTRIADRESEVSLNRMVPIMGKGCLLLRKAFDRYFF